MPLSAEQVTALLSNRRLPARGWDDAQIEYLLTEISLMDSNNFPDNVGVGEREGRVSDDATFSLCLLHAIILCFLKLWHLPVPLSPKWPCRCGRQENFVATSLESAGMRHPYCTVGLSYSTCPNQILDKADGEVPPMHPTGVNRYFLFF